MGSGAVAITHQKADQATVFFVHHLLADGERHPSRVHDREVIGHGGIKAHEAVPKQF